jgi:hypothetical protein
MRRLICMVDPRILLSFSTAGRLGGQARFNVRESLVAIGWNALKVRVYALSRLANSTSIQTLLVGGEVSRLTRPNKTESSRIANPHHHIRRAQNESRSGFGWKIMIAIDSHRMHRHTSSRYRQTYISSHGSLLLRCWELVMRDYYTLLLHELLWNYRRKLGILSPCS